MKSPTVPNPRSPEGAIKSPIRFSERTFGVLCAREDQERIALGRFPGRVAIADRLTEFVTLVESTPNPVVLLHPAALREADMETARIIRDLPCAPAVAVIGAKDHMDRAMGLARRLDLECVLPDDCLHHPIELERWIAWIEASGPELGMNAHLGAQAAISEIRVESKMDKPAAIAEILAYVGAIRADAKFLFELRLILEETINNAIFHAFCDGEGREKYTIENFTHVAPGESVTLAYGRDAHTIGVAVTDNQGRLRRDTILSKIQRQLSTQGIFDQSGRGLYLVYSLAGRLIFNLRPGKLTQAVALFPTSAEAWPHASPLRSLSVFDHS